MSRTMQKKFITLCYHYIRPDVDNPFPKILGTKKSDFVDHINFLKKKYSICEPTSIIDSDLSIDNRSDLGILFTFDDGLSDQFEAGEILRDENIRAIFFIPSCIIQDKLPANPIIIHYSLALYGLDKFIMKYNEILEGINLDRKLLIQRKRNESDLDTIFRIKKNFYYKMSPENTRAVLLKIFEDMSSDFGLKMKDIHLSSEQVHKLLKMGHAIGTHSHNHVSMLNPFLDSEEFKNEFISPKYALETTFNAKVDSMSYTYGDIGDFNKYNFTNPFKLIFSVEPKINNEHTLKTNVGRYEIHSTDTADKLKFILKNMDDNNEISDFN